VDNFGVFTGIIEAQALIKEKTDRQLVIEKPQDFDDIKIGSSVCVSGACLSVILFDENTMTFNVMEETLKCTKLGSLKVRDKVNLERSMKMSDRFEGHMVQGHVEGVGEVINIAISNRPLTPLPPSLPLPPTPSPRERGGLDTGSPSSSGGRGRGMEEDGRLTIKVPNALLNYIIPKGSIALDGVSLTVASISGNEVTVALIPHTLKNTTLGSLKRGDQVNVETDVLVRHSKKILVA